MTDNNGSLEQRYCDLSLISLDLERKIKACDDQFIQLYDCVERVKAQIQAELDQVKELNEKYKADFDQLNKQLTSLIMRFNENSYQFKITSLESKLNDNLTTPTTPPVKKRKRMNNDEQWFSASSSSSSFFLSEENKNIDRKKVYDDRSVFTDDDDDDD